MQTTVNRAEGIEPIHWEVEKSPLLIHIAQKDWSRYKTLQLKLNSARKTGAKVKIEILDLRETVVGQLTFDVDWAGPNVMELLLSNMEPRTDRNPDRWTDIGALRMSGELPGLWPTVLTVEAVTVLSRKPMWPVSEFDTLIDVEWQPSIRADEWRIDDQASDFPTGKFNPGRGVDAGKRVFGYIQGERPGSLCIRRRFGLDIRGYTRLLGKVWWDPDTVMTISAVVEEGRTLKLFDSESCSSEEAGQYVTVCADLQGAVWLESVSLSIREKTNRRVNGREVGLGLWWLLLRRPSALDDAPFQPVTVQLTGEWTSYPEQPDTQERMVRQIAFEESDSTTPIGEPLRDGLPFGFCINKQNLQQVRYQAIHGETRHVFARMRKEVDRVTATDRVDRNMYGTTYVGGIGMPIGYCGSGMRLFAPIAAAVHLITGEERYAVAARRWILRTVRSEAWTGEHYGLVGRAEEGDVGGHESFTELFPKGFIGCWFQTADVSYGLVLAYDMLYHCFSRQERLEVERAMADMGVFRVYSKLRFQRDKLVRSNTGLTFIEPLLMMTAFLKDRDPVYADIYQWSLAFMQEYGQHVWNEEGVCGEGPGYGIGTAASYVTALFTLSACTGKELRDMVPESYRSVWKYGLHCSSTWWEDRPNYMAFGDVSEKNWLRQSLLAFCASVYGDGEAKYLLETLDDDLPCTRLALIVLPASEVKATKPALPPAHVYIDEPMAFLRTGWQRGDTVLAMTNKSYSNHGHMDRASIILEFNGEQLLMDPGMVYYNSPSGHLLRKTASHNTLTLSQQDQRMEPRGAAERYRTAITDFLSTSGDRCPGYQDGIDWVIADATAVYPQTTRYVRHILFLRPGIAVLYDEVELSAPESIELNFICAGEVAAEQDVFASSGSRNRLLIHAQASRELVHKTEPWFSSLPNIQPCRLIVATAARETSCSFLTVLAPHAMGMPPPTIHKLAVDHGLGIRIAGEEWEDIVCCSPHGISNASIGVKSDARMVVLRHRQGSLNGMAMLDGTSLIKDNIELNVNMGKNKGRLMGAICQDGRWIVSDGNMFDL